MKSEREVMVSNPTCFAFCALIGYFFQRNSFLSKSNVTSFAASEEIPR